MQTALLQDLEVVSLTSVGNTNLQMIGTQMRPNQGETVSDSVDFSGNKIFMDAAWKLMPGHRAARPGIEIYMVIPGGQGEVANVFISASSSPVDSVIQAEAQALVLAGHIASSMMFRSPVFFSDNLNLARMVAAPRANSQASCWEIRRHAIEFQNTTELLSARIFHVKTNINVGAHYCAKQAKSSALAWPIRSCGNSAHRTHACPMLVAIDRLHLPEYVIHSVKCL
jgi:hypothetical protein